MPDVSVIIPTWNRRGFVLEAVASVLAQTFCDFELIVVDDGSGDGTSDALATEFSDPRLRILRQPNLGASAARNRGVEEACGRWVAFLDSDDLWLAAKLQRQVETLTEHPDCPACYTEEIWYRRGRWANPKAVHAKHSGWIFPQCLPLCIVSPSSVLMRREVFCALGGFDTSLPACEDYDLWLRLAARHPVHLLAEKLIVKRNGHPGQLSQTHWGLDRFRVRALWKLAWDETLPEPLLTLVLRTIAQKSAVVAAGAEKRGVAERARVFRHSQEEAVRWLAAAANS